MGDSKNASRPGSIRIIRNRIIQGLFAILPIFITFAVIKWLYDLFYFYALKPISQFLRVAWKLDGQETSWTLEIFLAIASIGMVLGVLFVAGMFFRSRIHRFVDWFLNKVPGVNTVYSAVSKVVDAISTSQNPDEKFKRVVLVEFPSPGFKAPAFVTGECIEATTGKTILSVYVPTTPIPTSGYMLLVEEKNVTELNWDLEETLQAIVSGGITVPEKVTYIA